MTMIEHLNHASRPTRREFTRESLRSLTAVALIEGLAAHRLAGQRRPAAHRRLVPRAARDQPDVADHKTRDVEFQKSLESLYGRVDLPALLKTLDFDRMAARVNYPRRRPQSRGRASRKSPACPRASSSAGRSSRWPGAARSSPTAMTTWRPAFWSSRHSQGRHWDRVEDHKDHYLIRPTIDRTFKPGEFSTVSDHRDNVHWFTARSEHAFLFNIHVNGSDAGNPKSPGGSTSTRSARRSPGA